MFSDRPEAFRRGEPADWPALLGGFPPLYHEPIGGLRNVFKLPLLDLMAERYPEEMIVWIDADMLIFGPLERHLHDGAVNVIAHGRRAGEVMDCGDGLAVPGERYAISGVFGIPPGPARENLWDIALGRPHWDGDGGRNRTIGDQLLLNHLVHRSGLPVQWISDDPNIIVNLEIAEAHHPVPGDPRLSEITWRSGPRLDDRPIVIWYWIKNQLDLHIDDGFATFDRSVARRLRRLYGVKLVHRDVRGAP